MMTFTRLHISVFLGAAVLVWTAVLYFKGVRLGWEEFGVHLAPFGVVVGVLVTLASLLEHRAWRLPVVHGWFVKRPDLRGTWRVQLESDWEDLATGRAVPPITCYMGVEQTLSTLQMHLMTNESESWFIADRITPSRNATGYQVVGVYTNQPGIHLRGDRSETHQGALILETHGATHRPDSLTGEYWTDRKTTGRMVLSDRQSRVFTRFGDAEQTFADRV